MTTREVALLVATACAAAPKGRSRWTLQLLAGELVRLTEHEDVSRETVRRHLLENELKPWRGEMWCIPKLDSEYVARMEDVLDLYAEEPPPQRPVGCFDEGASIDPGRRPTGSGLNRSKVLGAIVKLDADLAPVLRVAKRWQRAPE
jgi:hypothetical protein